MKKKEKKELIAQGKYRKRPPKKELKGIEDKEDKKRSTKTT